MSEPTTGAYEYTCAISGEKSPGKHYILTTTEGQETIAPESLFHNAADRKMGQLVLDMAARLKRLESRLLPPQETAEPEAATEPDTQDHDQEQEQDQDQEQEEAGAQDARS